MRCVDALFVRCQGGDPGRGTAVLPAENRGQCLPRVAVPGHHAGALRRQAGAADRSTGQRRVRQHLLHHPVQGGENLVRVLLCLAVTACLQVNGLPGLCDHPALRVEHDGARGVRALVDGKDQGAHIS